jgi:DNA helicase HerA-like ATPase
MTLSLGRIYLPSNPGTPVGKFDFIVDKDAGAMIEVGTPVAADTVEGTVIGAVIDMRTVGTASDPVAADLSGNSQLARLADVVVATVQVFDSPLMRPVRAGMVRAASAEEMLRATGYQRMDWPIPAGLVPLADGDFAPVCFDGNALLGPESAHLTVGGLSGQAAKTSYIGMLLRSAISRGGPGHSVAALVFNVKGEDLIWLDEAPAKGYELTDDDLAMYAALGVPATPFDDVIVYAPALPATSTGSRSPRPDAMRLGWDLPMVWPYLKYFLSNVIYEDEKVSSFLAEFRNFCLQNPDPLERIDSFDKLEAWFNKRLGEAEENDTPYAWRSHHKATMWRIKRMLSGILSRSGGLVISGASRAVEDVPDKGWQHAQVIVVDIAGMNTDVQSVVIARTLERMLRSAENGELGVDHLVVVADELNAFAPAQGGEMAAVKKVLQKVATQGRYAGISLWGAGQKLSKVDELVRDNAATRAMGITADGELASGVYGRMPAGLVERIATLPKGFMALSHYSFRAPLMVRFPRPAWRTGKAKTSAGSRPVATSALNLSRRSVDRLTEGVHPDLVEEVMNSSPDAQTARERLEMARVPDMSKTALHAPSTFDPSNPFDLS